MFLSIDYMKIILFINALYLYYRKSNTFNMMKFYEPLIHQRKQPAPICLWWYF